MRMLMSIEAILVSLVVGAVVAGVVDTVIGTTGCERLVAIKVVLWPSWILMVLGMCVYTKTRRFAAWLCGK